MATIKNLFKFHIKCRCGSSLSAYTLVTSTFWRYILHRLNGFVGISFEQGLGCNLLVEIYYREEHICGNECTSIGRIVVGPNEPLDRMIVRYNISEKD